MRPFRSSLTGGWKRNDVKIKADDYNAFYDVCVSYYFLDLHIRVDKVRINRYGRICPVFYLITRFVYHNTYACINRVRTNSKLFIYK